MQNVLDLKRRTVEPPLAVSESPEPSESAVASEPSEWVEDTPLSEPPVRETEEAMDPVALATTLLESAQLPATAAWTAHHPLRGEARRKHLYVSIGLVAFGVAIAVMQSSVVPFFVLLAGAVALELREHLSKPIEVQVDATGVAVNGHRHDHASFASFHIHRMPDETLELSLKGARRFVPDIRLPLGEQDPYELHAVLTQYIPEGEHRIPLIEYVLRKPRG